MLTTIAITKDTSKLLDAYMKDWDIENKGELVDFILREFCKYNAPITMYKERTKFVLESKTDG